MPCTAALVSETQHAQQGHGWIGRHAWMRAVTPGIRVGSALTEGRVWVVNVCPQCKQRFSHTVNTCAPRKA